MPWDLFLMKKIVEMWGLWVPWTVHETHWCAEKVGKSKIVATVYE